MRPETTLHEGPTVRSFVIGWGEVGRRLGGCLTAHGLEVIPVTRDDGWDRAASIEPGLRVVCVREDDLPAVIERLEGVDPGALVFVQNGWIRDLVPQPSTRGLIWFTSKGEFFRPLRPSPFCGPAAGVLTDAMNGAGIPATRVAPREFDALDADKMGFNCVVGLPLAVHGLSLGQYLETRTDEARRVFSEAVDACCRATGCHPPRGAWEAFVAAVEPLHWVTASRAKALDWRNRAVVRLAEIHGGSAEANRRLLDAAVEDGT